MSQRRQKEKRGKDMKIRLIGFLTKKQIEDSMAQLDKIAPEKGTVHVKSNLTFTYTFKRDKVVGVTIRRAPNFKFLNDEDQAAKPEETPEPKAPEPKFKVGDKVRINWQKTLYLKSPSYIDSGTVVKVKGHREDKLRYVVSDFYTLRKSYELTFTEDHLESYVEETKAELKVGDIVKVKHRSDVDATQSPYYMREMETYAGKQFRVDSVRRPYIRLEDLENKEPSLYEDNVSEWLWNEDWLTLVSKKDA